MTKEEARKKAEEWAQSCADLIAHQSGGISCLDDVTLTYIKDSYLQCFNDMTTSKPDGFGVEYDGELRSDSVGEYQFSSGFGNEVVLCFTDKQEAEDYIETLQPTSAKIEVVPVKLLVMEEKSESY